MTLTLKQVVSSKGGHKYSVFFDQVSIDDFFFLSKPYLRIDRNLFCTEQSLIENRLTNTSLIGRSNICTVSCSIEM